MNPTVPTEPDPTPRPTSNGGLLRALSAPDTSVRLRAALAAGTLADPTLADVVVQRCAVESDFFVRDMLTWSLTRLPADIIVPRLIDETVAEGAQARSQALHTLSKIGDARAWPALTPALLHDRDTAVARAAWRAATALVPTGSEHSLASELATELGRRDAAAQRSLSRALACLGEASAGVLAIAAQDPDPQRRDHAAATARLLADPDSTFESDAESVERVLLSDNRDSGEE